MIARSTILASLKRKDKIKTFSVFFENVFYVRLNFLKINRKDNFWRRGFSVGGIMLLGWLFGFGEGVGGLDEFVGEGDHIVDVFGESALYPSGEYADECGNHRGDVVLRKTLREGYYFVDLPTG